MAVEPDFGGYATKAGLRCSDGRVIRAEAFQHMDGHKVPLVWNHGHSSVENLLGHAVLEHRKDGVYAYGFFNSSPHGQKAKIAVQHGDVNALSIYANQLKEINKNVSHGNIREVSLVLAGANPGATIDQVKIQHSSDPDDVTEIEDEAIIHHMGDIKVFPKAHPENEGIDLEHADEETLRDIYNSLNPDQENLVHFMVGQALKEKQGNKAVTHSEGEKPAEEEPKNSSDDSAKVSETDAATEDEDTKKADEKSDNDTGLAHQEGSTMSRNVFEQASAEGTAPEKHALSHADMKGIFAQAAKLGSLKEAVEQYADKHLQHGIENIDILFPDAKNITGTPEMEKRRTEWVSDVLANVRKLPFSRIKTMSGDLTQDDARAKGYIKGHYKKEEWFGVTKRTTTPTTIYKKQKLDRDDILDITDFDVVLWLKAEMRLMTEEEIARAILIGDGRDISDEDKVKDPQGASDGSGIRSILRDHELFVTTLRVNVDDANSSYEEVVEAAMDGMQYYKGAGSPTMYSTVYHINQFLKARDANGRRFYENRAALAEALGVRKIVAVEAMQTQEPDVIGIIVNLDDYATGTDRGGELTMFDDFDIDYNQYKYLLETRLSGGLTKPKTAVVIRKTGSASVLATPLKPSFVASSGVITIPTVTGVDYKDSEGNTLSSGAQTALSAGQTKTVYATPKNNFHFADTVNDSWPFKRPTA